VTGVTWAWILTVSNSTRHSNAKSSFELECLSDFSSNSPIEYSHLPQVIFLAATKAVCSQKRETQLQYDSRQQSVAPRLQSSAHIAERGLNHADLGTTLAAVFEKVVTSALVGTAKIALDTIQFT
jgi:hypothetical protein